MSNTPILQEIHAELSLCQKIKLLAKIYMRQFYGLLGLGFQTTLDLVGVIFTLGYYNPFKTTSPGEIMAEKLGQKLPRLRDADWFTDKVWSSQNRLVSGSQQAWEQEICNRLNDGNLLNYCTVEELDEWYRQDKLYGFKHVNNIHLTLKNRGKGWSTRLQLTQPSYYSGSVPLGSYYVDLRWDTVANGEVNYKDFWRTQ